MTEQSDKEKIKALLEGYRDAQNERRKLWRYLLCEILISLTAGATFATAFVLTTKLLAG